MHVYRIRTTGITVLWRLIEPPIFALLGLGCLAIGALAGGHLATRLFLLVVATSAFYLCIRGLRIPGSIEVGDDGTLNFDSLLGLQSVAAGCVLSMVPGKELMRTLVLRHSGGRILLIRHFERFSEFVSDVRRFNPSAEIVA